MRVQVRLSLLALLVGAIVIASAPAAQAAFGVEKFFAANCDKGFEKCGEGAKEAGKAEAEAEGYRVAGGHPYFGVTDFVLNTVEPEPGLKVPAESLKNLRVDVAPGVVTNPQAVPYCSVKTSPRPKSNRSSTFSSHRNVRKARSSANSSRRPCSKLRLANSQMYR